MTALWVVGACLLAGALLFLLPPLLQRQAAAGRGSAARDSNIRVYRDQLDELQHDLLAGTLSADQYEQSRREIESRALRDVAATARSPADGGRWLGLIVGLGVPALAVLLYLQLGSPGLVGERRTDGGGATHAMDVRQIQQMVDGLARRLAENPRDPDGWVMLARSYTALGRHADALIAYSRAAEQRPDDAQLLADYADTLAFTQGRRLAGRPAELIRRALRADPGNLKALALAGSEAYERRDYAEAASYWERLLERVPEGTELARAMRANVQEARALQAGGVAGGTQAAARPGASAAAAKVTGTVTLSPALAAGAAPDDTVFVFARALEGSRMPLAILRRKVRDLPAAFELDDTLAMSPGQSLSRHRQVAVGARVSRSGNATPQPGDLQGLVQPVAVGATGVRVVIDQPVP